MAAAAPPPAAAPPAAAGAAPTKSVLGAAPGVPPGQNKPDEPPFQLKLEPDTRMVFKGDKLGEAASTVDVKLTNTSKDRHSFKVKCTSNEIFRVRPPLGFVDGEQTMTIKVTFQPKAGQVPDNGKHFFAFYHVKSAEQKPARQVWTPTTKPDGVKRVLVHFEKEDGSPAATAPAPAAGAAAPPAPPAAGGAPPAAGAAPAPAAPPAAAPAAPPAAAPAK